MIKSPMFSKVGRLGTATVILVALGSMMTVDAVAAQEPAPAPVPPSTNPTERVIYPAEGQPEEQQLSDQLECYRFATTQTAWDPHQAADVMQQKYGQAQSAQNTQGTAVRGAARGAVAGLAIGAIAGDAGMGAAIGATAGGLSGGRRSRRQAQSAASAYDVELKAFQDQLGVWDRNYVACMQAKKYVVN